MTFFKLDIVSSATNTTNLVIKGCDRDSHVAKTGCVDSHSDHYFQDGQGVNINKYIIHSSRELESSVLGGF